MAEEGAKTRERNGTEKKLPVLLHLLEKLLGTFEGFADRVLDQVSDHAHRVMNRGVERLFGLLVLGAGAFFFLSGGAQMIDSVAGIPGVGHMVLGLIILLVTSLILLFSRERRE